MDFQKIRDVKPHPHLKKEMKPYHTRLNRRLDSPLDSTNYILYFSRSVTSNHGKKTQNIPQQLSQYLLHSLLSQVQSLPIQLIFNCNQIIPLGQLSLFLHMSTYFSTLSAFAVIHSKLHFKTFWKLTWSTRRALREQKSAKYSATTITIPSPFLTLQLSAVIGCLFSWNRIITLQWLSFFLHMSTYCNTLSTFVVIHSKPDSGIQVISELYLLEADLKRFEEIW